MGFIFTKDTPKICGCFNKLLNDKDVYIDTKIDEKSFDINKIIKLQSAIRMFLNQIKKFPNKFMITKEISMDYNIEYLEDNPNIIKLNNLLPKFELTEKEVYEINNSKHKIKALIYYNKSIYKGMVNNNLLREGYGKLYLPNGSIYKGFFHKNLMEGHGRLLNINGYLYEGEFLKGLSNGYGKFISLDGTSYKGNWYKDKQNGFGEETYPDGSYYMGYFQNGKKHGQGKLTFKEKNIYQGSFQNNEIKGEGKFIWKDGRSYFGKWDQNKMNGYGIFLWPDKKKYYGHYSNNLKDGFGIFQWNDGHKYEGFWKNGKQDGYGIIEEIKSKSSPIPVVSYGKWSYGKLVAKIDDDEFKDKIDTMIKCKKLTKEFLEFKYNIEKYEKYLISGSSSIDTIDNIPSNTIKEQNLYK